MPTVTRERREGKNPLSKTFSPDMQRDLDTYVELNDRYDKTVMSMSTALYPTGSISKLSNDMDKLGESLNRTQTSDKLDEILKVEVLERLEIMRIRLESTTDRNFDCNKIFRAYGIGENDIKMMEEHFRKINFVEVADRWVETNGNSYEAAADSTQELERIKKIYEKLVEVSFQLAPKDITSSFANSADYVESTVKFSDDRNNTSYSSANLVYWNLYTPKFIKIKEDMRYSAVPDIFNAARAVGEEGLLGHQGQFLRTEGEKTRIPKVLTISSSPVNTASVEALGEMGSLNMLKQLERNTGMFSDVSEGDFKFIKQRFELGEKMKTIQRFLYLYKAYTFFNNGRNAKKTAEIIYDITKSPSILSEAYVRETDAHFNSGKFWATYGTALDVSAYLYADIKAADINKKLEGVSEESRTNIQSNINLGYWTKKGFEQYVDYLFEKFS